MKTPMNIYNTAMKKKKNRKGFSLVELIVVLVIMAILAAALIPSLMGYIRKPKSRMFRVNAKQQSRQHRQLKVVFLHLLMDITNSQWVETTM